MRTTLILMVLIGLVCGCASEHFVKGRGDLGQFMVQQANWRCHLNTPTNGLPVISGHWRYHADDNGVLIRMSPAMYPQVKSFLQGVYGKPAFGPLAGQDGGELGEYRLTPKGGVIQFFRHQEYAQVGIIRPLTQTEFDEAFTKALQTIKDQKTAGK